MGAYVDFRRAIKMPYLMKNQTQLIAENLLSEFGDRRLVARFGNHVSRLYGDTRVVYGAYIFYVILRKILSQLILKKLVKKKNCW